MSGMTELLHNTLSTSTIYGDAYSPIYFTESHQSKHNLSLIIYLGICVRVR